ncbi:glycoside hydrolase family 88 protein [Mucilaginibacter sp. SMC90]|uniref:glycoside hydrolase family 88 protein n=1 Tax=Mucilaginibacter sp. SMC90 TaxID=2929803 RepID=UPI001FB1D089|nr:glycoside hydrolase family 88 protein [Mucilaginibacter sp. SMC90]UOE47243.1 glycoside hydrolase family 88 protein [Mucilaginibacter sp. SMC90]
MMLHAAHKADTSSTNDVHNDFVHQNFLLSAQQYNGMLRAATDISRYPRTINARGEVISTDIGEWTVGFWPGCLWYEYEYFKTENWKAVAEKWTRSLEKAQYNTTTHDLGFMMYCSFGNAYRLTGNKAYRDVLIKSAESLITRFNPKVGAIKSWDSFKSWDGHSVYNFPVIIDNMMNLELLFFASKVTGNPKYKNIAIKHAETTLKNHLRPDYSAYHVVNYDPQTGKVLSRETKQGFADNSAWSRGQAWAIYSFTVAYRETHKKEFLNAAIKTAYYFLNEKNLPADKIPYWDFNVNQSGFNPRWSYDPSKYKTVPRDASAAAVASSAFLELCTFTGSNDRSRLFGAAKEMLETLSTKTYRADVGTNGFFILKHSVGSLPNGVEIDVPLIYADYYYLEALLRYQKLTSPVKF